MTWELAEGDREGAGGETGVPSGGRVHRQADQGKARLSQAKSGMRVYEGVWA